jgi:hypothetical protein
MFTQQRVRAPAAVAALLLSGLVLGGCASTQLGAQWVDPQLPRQALRGASVLVVCEAIEPAVKLLCESQVSSQLLLLGLRPVTDATLVNPTPGREPPAGQYLAAAKALGASGVFSATLTPDFSLTSSVPSFSIGIGGFGGSGGYRGGSSVGGGVGVTLPIGATPGASGMAGVGSIVETATGRVLWSAKATTPPGADAAGQIAEVTRALTQAAQQAGLF